MNEIEAWIHLRFVVGIKNINLVKANQYKSFRDIPQKLPNSVA